MDHDPADRWAAMEQESVMDTRRWLVGLTGGLLVLGGVAGTANAQTDPGPDPNESGVTETADLDEGTEVPDPDDSVASPEEAAENAEGEQEEAAEAEDAAPVPEAADAPVPEAADAPAPSDPEPPSEALDDDGEDSADDGRDGGGDGSGAGAEVLGSGASPTMVDSPVAARPTFAG